MVSYFWKVTPPKQHITNELVDGSVDIQHPIFRYTESMLDLLHSVIKWASNLSVILLPIIQIFT